MKNFEKKYYGLKLIQDTLLKKAMTLLLFMCLFFTGITPVQAAGAPSIVTSGASLEKWSPYDFQFTSNMAYANQFLVTMSATFTGPNGITLTVPGYFTKSNTWVVRFSPTAEGTWNYSTSSTDAQLNGQTGSITCVAKTNPNVHGQLKIDPLNPRHFIYEDGTRYFQLGYEIDWLGMMDFGDLNVTKTRSIIDIISANGFNEVTMALFAYDTPWKAGKTGPEDFGPPAEFPWEYTGTKNASSNRFNQAFWENYDRVVDYLYQKGITAHIYLRMQPNKYVSGMYPLRQSAQENLLLQYATARYQAYPNVIWDYEKETNPAATIPILVERQQFIKNADGYHRLRTQHDADGFSLDANANKSIDFYTDQNHPQQNGGMYASIISQRSYLPYPILNAEYGYQVGNDGGRTYSSSNTVGDMLQRTCEVLMAGGYAAYYYTYHAWDLIKYNETPNSLNLYLKLSNFFKSTKWYTLSPNDALIGGGAIGKHCLAKPGSEYIVYLQSGAGSVNLTIGGAASGTPLSVKWVDINNGSEVAMPNVGNGISTFTKPASMTSSVAMLYISGNAPTNPIITASAGANGTISPSGSVTVNSGASQSFAITPNSGFQIDVLTIDGVSQPITNPYNFANVTANHSISVTFKANLVQFAITASAGANGTISPSGSVTVNSGASQSFSITPNSGFQIDVLTIDGVSKPITNPYNFANVTANHSITVTLKVAKVQYAITATAGANGSISPSGSVLVDSLTSQTYSITPNSCSVIEDVKVDGISQGAISSYTFTNVTAIHTISATFKSKQYTITASAGTNGSISPSGTILVNCGANTCFTVVPNSGYIIDTVFVDGISQGAATCINNITSNHTISATFKVADQPVSAITGWVSGTNNTKVVGSNRLMVVMVMGESKSSFGANGVTYGGQPMTKQTDKMYFVSGNRTYASIFTLNEAGVNAAASGAIAVTWSATPSVGNSIYSVLLSNVDQTTSVSTSLNNALTGTSIATATTLAAATGDMAIMCGATENNVIQTFNNGFIKQFETNSTWGDGVGGYKLGTGINETPKFTQSTSGRMAICALVVKKVSSFISPSRTSKNIQTTNAEVNGIRVYPNPVSDILYVDFAGVEASREIKVFDMEGQLLRSIKTSNSTVQIDVKSLKIKGNLILQVFDGMEVSSHMIIVK